MGSHKTGYMQSNRDGDHDGVNAEKRNQDAKFPPADNGTCL